MNSDSLQPVPQKQCARCKDFFPATLDFFHAKTRNKDHLRESCKKCCGSSRRGIPKIPDGNKRCPDCKQVFPRTTEYFFANKNARGGGIGGYCKSCTHVRYVEECKENKQNKQPDAMICNKCGNEKPATEHFFERSPVSQYGLNTVCRVCRNTRRATLFRQNPEKTRTRERKYASQKSLRAKQQYQLHIEEIRVYRRAQYASNPERIKAYQRRYSRSERGLEGYRVRNHRRRANKKAVKGNYTHAQIQEQLQRQHYHCYYAACGFSKLPRVKKNRKWKYIYHVEHTFPLSRVAGTDIPANDISYLVLSCQSCNDKKGNKYPWEWPEGGRLL